MSLHNFFSDTLYFEQNIDDSVYTELLTITKDSRILTKNGDIYDEVLRHSRFDTTLISKILNSVNMQNSELMLLANREDAGEYICCINYQDYGNERVFCSNPMNVTVT